MQLKLKRVKALERVREHVRSIRGFEGEVEGFEVIPENSPVGESQSNGVAEIEVKHIQGQIGTVKVPLEHALWEKIDITSGFVGW